MKTIGIWLAVLLMSCSDGGSDSGSWGFSQSVVTDQEFHSRANHSMCSIDDKVYVFGGYGTNLVTNAMQAFNGGFVYDATDNSIEALTIDEQVPTARQWHQCSVLNDLLFIWGGRTASGSALKSGAFYDPAIKNWTELPTANAHSQTYNQSQAVVGEVLFSWGGGSTGVNTGSRYEFTTNSWNTLPTSQAPAARTLHSTVATETSVIVWGGSSGTVYYHDGFIYDVAANTWTEIDDAAAPSARSGHTAVWTGEKMIVWGGYNGKIYLNDGGIYDPSTDSWETITSAQIVGRVDHVAVWTGTYMMIWGGTTADGVTNTGAAYHLESNGWSDTGDFGLTPRIGHRAVWTGKALFLYGGWDSQYASFGPGDNKYRNNGVIITF